MVLTRNESGHRKRTTLVDPLPMKVKGSIDAAAVILAMGVCQFVEKHSPPQIISSRARNPAPEKQSNARFLLVAKGFSE